MADFSEEFDDFLNDDEHDAGSQPENTGLGATAEVATETPAAQEQVEEAAQPEIPEGYKQDERGRWHRPDGTIATKEETEKFGAAAVSPADSQQPPPAAEPEPPKPFTYKALGADHPLDGATLDANGNLVVTKEALPNLLPMLARAQEFPTFQSREAKLNNEVQQFRTQSRELSVRAEKAEFAYQHLAAILDNEEKLAAFLTDPREREYALRELQLGMKNAEIARATADRASESQAQTAEQTAVQEQETITSAIDQLAKAPELAGFITPEDLEETKAYFKEMRGAIVKTAEDDSLKPYGISKGEKYVVHQPMIQYLSRIATERRKAKEQIEAATKASKFNAATKPAVAPPKKAPAPVAAGKPKKEKKGWEESYKAAWNAEDDDE